MAANRLVYDTNGDLQLLALKWPGLHVWDIP
jgi:hypothetical protein